ncbi:MAG: lactonase family protein [Proteobacteria bacterium]|nr:lactonase family protein [Pseudomonadota bacterium]
MTSRLMKCALWLLLWPIQLMAATTTAWIGTYTADDSHHNTGSSGIYSVQWNSDSGTLSALHVAGKTSNPSFLALHPNGRYLYAVNEDSATVGTDRITAFSIGDPGSAQPLKELGLVSSQGVSPCHLIVDSTGKWLFVANYTSGTIAVYPVGADGRLGQAHQTIQQRGSGPVNGHQESAHAHEVVQSPDGRFLLVADLGADRVFVYRFDVATGTLSPNDPPAAVLPAGYGPRHMVFSRDTKRVYVLTELKSAVVTLRWNPQLGTLTQVALTPALPAGTTGEQSGAEIALHPNGEFLYASSRGDSNTITAFHIGHDGVPVVTGNVPSGGREPRYFGIDPSGRFVIAANQLTGDLFTFRIDPASGALSRVGDRFPVPAPVHVLFAPPRGH